MSDKHKEIIARAYAHYHGNPDLQAMAGLPWQAGGKQFMALSDYNQPLPFWHFFLGEAQYALTALDQAGYAIVAKEPK